jgi:hypothetical protein
MTLVRSVKAEDEQRSIDLALKKPKMRTTVEPRAARL